MGKCELFVNTSFVQNLKKRTCPVCAIFNAASDGNNWRAVTCNYARGISYQLKLTTDVIWQYANEEIGFKQFSHVACK